MQIAEITSIIRTDTMKFWERNKILAHLTIANKEYKIRTSEPKYSFEDIKEFKIQINELLSQKQISNSNSHHQSATFMVRNKIE